MSTGTGRAAAESTHSAEPGSGTDCWRGRLPVRAPWSVSTWASGRPLPPGPGLSWREERAVTGQGGVTREASCLSTPALHAQRGWKVREEVSWMTDTVHLTMRRALTLPESQVPSLLPGFPRGHAHCAGNPRGRGQGCAGPTAARAPTPHLCSDSAGGEPRDLWCWGTAPST